MPRRPKGGGCAHTSREMIAYIASADAPHAAAFWCTRCGALGWSSYGRDGAESWRLPELHGKAVAKPRRKRRPKL